MVASDRDMIAATRNLASANAAAFDGLARDGDGPGQPLPQRPYIPLTAACSPSVDLQYGACSNDRHAQSGRISNKLPDISSECIIP